jgi:hypothetical protein
MILCGLLIDPIQLTITAVSVSLIANRESIGRQAARLPPIPMPVGNGLPIDLISKGTLARPPPQKPARQNVLSPPRGRSPTEDTTLIYLPLSTHDPQAIQAFGLMDGMAVGV